MGQILKSVGLDVGTTSTQLVVSELTVVNQAGSFAVPEMEITQRRICYKSPVHFTPLLRDKLVDGDALRKIVESEYRQAGITKDQVDTGAVIITGETSRKENAQQVLESLSDFAGDFVVATAGPDLESILAAKGAGAAAYSEATGKTLLHMDIGGGTSNLARIEGGRITATGCMNVGGRLVKLDANSRLTYVSPVLEGLFPKKVGEFATQGELETLADLLVQALEMVAGLRESTDLLHKLWTQEIPFRPLATGEKLTISFSGGVADCIETAHPALTFGDLGPILGQAIRRSRLCAGPYRLGDETIRATVIGAGCHSAQLSGSTVFCRNVEFPLKNLPVSEDLDALSRLDTPGVLALPGIASASYGQIAAMAAELAAQWGDRPVYLALERDMAMALGQPLALRLPENTPISCIDRVRLKSGDYLDVGHPIGPAFPVVVKTLVLGK